MTEIISTKLCNGPLCKGIEKSTTEFSMLVRLNGDKTKQIEEEAKKCRLLCCKCHRIVTAEQFNFNYEVPQIPTPPIE